MSEANSRAASGLSLDVALDNFLGFLPVGIERWVLWSEPAHESIREKLLAHLSVAHDLVLGVTDVDEVERVATNELSDPACGLLCFQLVRGESESLYSPYQAALHKFMEWPPHRVRLMNDVRDDTFVALFGESSAELAARCADTAKRLCAESTFVYSPGSSEHDVVFTCSSDGWTIYDGVNDTSDYQLPIGEVACEPLSVDGRLVVDGWIIGTIPFGAKYGRIHPGELVIQFTEGRITELAGSRAKLVKDLEVCLDRIPGLRVVGEFGVGQSISVAELARDDQYRPARWHERHLGIHVGLGAELPETLDPDARSTNHHVDIVQATGELRGANEAVLRW